MKWLLKLNRQMLKEVSNAARENGTEGVECLQNPPCRPASCAARSAGQLILSNAGTQSPAAILIPVEPC